MLRLLAKLPLATQFGVINIHPHVFNVGLDAKSMGLEVNKIGLDIFCFVGVVIWGEVDAFNLGGGALV